MPKVKCAKLLARTNFGRPLYSIRDVTVTDVLKCTHIYFLSHRICTYQGLRKLGEPLVTDRATDLELEKQLFPGEPLTLEPEKQ